MKLPQIIMIALLSMGCGVAMIKDGEPKEDKYSFWVTLLSSGIEIALLWWGGFFG